MAKQRAKTFFAVNCEKHGTHQPKAVAQKFLKVGAPKSKKQAFHSGCPLCKAGLSI